jgi:uncharacterized peroxidase-related enzyme
MSILTTVPEDDASGLIKELYDADVRSLGHVAGYTKAMALNPEALKAFETLVRAIAGQLGLRRYELVTLAAATALESQPCRAAHSRKSLAVMEEADILGALGDFRGSGRFTEAEIAMMEFAQKLSRDAAAMTDADAGRLRDVGFTDREIVDITLAASVRNYYSRALHGLGVGIDDTSGLSAGLVDAIGD